MLGEHRRDMGVVVLDGIGRQAQRERFAGGEKVRVQIVGDRDRFHLEGPGEVLQRLLEEGEGRAVVEVAEVLGDEGLVAPGEAEGVLERGPQGQHLRHLAAELHRLGHPAARAANERGAPFAPPGPRCRRRGRRWPGCG
jgi:hypothetical protein